MKNAILAILLFSMNAAFSQGLIFSTVDEVPETLNLEIEIPFAGEALLYHVEDDGGTKVKVDLTKFPGLKDFMVRAQGRRFVCDGSFKLEEDTKEQRIKVESLSMCLNMHGMPIVYSVGMKQTQKELNQKFQKLSAEVEERRQPSVVYDGFEDLDDEIVGPAQPSTGSKGSNN